MSTTKLIESRGRRREALKTLLGGGAFAAAGLAATPQVYADQPTVSDADILNLALNLEYLEAEYYLNAVNGSGLEAAGVAVTGTGTAGSVIIKANPKVPFTTDAIRQYAMEIAEDEMAHVAFLRTALNAAGGLQVARPAIDLQASFTAAARAAKLIKKNETFDPFANEVNFLLGAFIFEDVGVTAYKGAAGLINNGDYLEAAAGILGTEAYHAGLVRTLLFQLGETARDAAEAISRLRDSLDGGGSDDQDLSRKKKANLVPTDDDGLCFSRSARDVLQVVYANKKAKPGGFFPAGLNGTIR